MILGIYNPGSWQSYASRPSNKKRTIMEIRNSYLTELNRYESYMSHIASQQALIGNSGRSQEEQTNNNSNQSFTSGFSNGFQ